jgi:hypothetical protein
LVGSAEVALCRLRYAGYSDDDADERQDGIDWTFLPLRCPSLLPGHPGTWFDDFDVVLRVSQFVIERLFVDLPCWATAH